MTAGNYVITGRLSISRLQLVRTDIVVLPISWKVPVVVVSSLAYCPGTHKQLIKCSRIQFNKPGHCLFTLELFLGLCTADFTQLFRVL